jgi:hypothetical protein
MSDQQSESLVRAVPGLARVAAGALWRTMQWGVASATTTSTEALRAVAKGESPVPIVAAAIDEVLSIARGLLGRQAPAEHDHQRPPNNGASPAELRARGARLLYDAADVWFEDDTHPAYSRILDELSPDEARILRLLALEGAQPSIDIRTNRPLGVGSELVAGGLSMIGLQAGVRHLDRTKADLNNLYRLGLVWFSREEVDDPTRYQVVEVQPDVLEAMKRAGRSPKTIHRSIHLTPFGEDFCTVCFPLELSRRRP